MNIEVRTNQKQNRKNQLFAGKWYNRHNSEIDLCVEDDGYISGTFTTMTKGKAEVFTLTGFVSNDVIAFCVAFRKYGSVTSWTGQLACVSDGEQNYSIQALWHMALDLGERQDTDLWRGTLSGFDVFKMGPIIDDSKIEDMTPPSHPWWTSVSEPEDPETYF